MRFWNTLLVVTKYFYCLERDEKFSRKKIIFKNQEEILESIIDQNIHIKDQDILTEDQGIIIEDQEMITEDQEIITKDQNMITEDHGMIIGDDKILRKDQDLVRQEQSTLFQKNSRKTDSDSSLEYIGIYLEPETIPGVSQEPETIPGVSLEPGVNQKYNQPKNKFDGTKNPEWGRSTLRPDLCLYMVGWKPRVAKCK